MHNLRNVDVDIPRGKFVVVSGLSGSGKSALVFDTLFAESQRRFLDSLSTYARQFHGQLQRPDVDTIEGLPPAIAVDQRTRSFSARSTLATLTEIHDFLRLLYARAGQAHCPTCDREVAQQSVEVIVQQILGLGERRKVMVLAPLVRGRRGLHRDVFERITRAGLVRARVDGDVVDAADPPELNARKNHDIDAVVDRIVVKEGIESRLRESIDLAVREADGTCLISYADEERQWHDRLYSTRFACPECRESFPGLELRSFSFNSPYGACPECHGSGHSVDESGEDEAADDGEPAICPGCDGQRLAPFPRSVRFLGRTLADFSALSVDAAREIATDSLSQAADLLSAEAAMVARETIPDIIRRLEYLQHVGLGYLTLDRSARTLSGGEFQRSRLAKCLGSGLTGACYILDEPTVGLHPRDTKRLIGSLRELRDQGNTVVVVEHDEEVIRAADHLIEIGPGAGADGGLVIARGTLEDVRGADQSATGAWLRGELAQAASTSTLFQPDPDTRESIRVISARANNLKSVDITIPRGALTCVTGVSGSGKSSLVTDVLTPIARAVIQKQEIPQQLCESATGLDAFQRLLECDARPLGKSGRANPATISGIWTEIRRLFAMTREARLRGFTARRFSFNVKEGNCPECRGQGINRVRMKFMPDILVECSVCRGARFNRQTLSVRFQGKTVADVLAMRIDEAADHFSNFDRIHRTLQAFCDIGLGYLALGQPAHTLSGGEAQRVKLATGLGQTVRGESLYVLDEPTAGLHAADVQRLRRILRKLVDAGHTLVVVEHHLDLIATADWVVDLGPESGDAGGFVTAMGPPPTIASSPESHTGAFLRERPEFSGGQ